MDLGAKSGLPRWSKPCYPNSRITLAEVIKEPPEVAAVHFAHEVQDYKVQVRILIAENMEMRDLLRGLVLSIDAIREGIEDGWSWEATVSPKISEIIMNYRDEAEKLLSRGTKHEKTKEE